VCQSVQYTFPSYNGQVHYICNFFRSIEILLMCICACCMHVVCSHGLDVGFVLSFFFISLCGGCHGGSELTCLASRHLCS